MPLLLGSGAVHLTGQSEPSRQILGLERRLPSLTFQRSNPIAIPVLLSLRPLPTLHLATKSLDDFLALPHQHLDLREPPNRQGDAGRQAQRTLVRPLLLRQLRLQRSYLLGAAGNAGLNLPTARLLALILFIERFQCGSSGADHAQALGGEFDATGLRLRGRVARGRHPGEVRRRLVQRALARRSLSAD